MHELAIAQAAIELAEQAAEGRRVRRVTLELGEFWGVLPEVGHGAELAGRLDCQPRVLGLMPPRPVEVVEAAVLHEGLVDVDRVDAERGSARRVVELDAEAPSAGGGAVRHAETTFHWSLPRRGPKRARTSWLLVSPNSRNDMEPRAPEADAHRDDLSVRAETVPGGDSKSDVLIDAATRP